MRPTKRPLSTSEKKVAICGGFFAAVVISFGVGMATMHSYEEAYRTPLILENLRSTVQKGLIDRAKRAFHDDDLALLSFVSGLRQMSIAEAYNLEISTLRSNAFDVAFSKHDFVALKAIDTRMADELLIDAMGKLGDQDLFGVLQQNSHLFLANNGWRAAMLSDTDSTDAETRSRNLYWAHTTLSEKDRDALTECYLKLEEKLREMPADHLRFDAGSGTCIVPVHKQIPPLFNPREYLKYQ